MDDGQNSTTSRNPQAECMRVYSLLLIMFDDSWFWSHINCKSLNMEYSFSYVSENGNSVE